LTRRFISSNPGLESRFNRYFLFEDYNGDELFEIFMSMCRKNGYEPDEDAERYLSMHFAELYMTRDENFGNARDVRNLFENIVSVQSDRVAAMENAEKKDLCASRRRTRRKPPIVTETQESRGLFKGRGFLICHDFKKGI
jgi:hypothetical protein